MHSALKFFSSLFLSFVLLAAPAFGAQLKNNLTVKKLSNGIELVMRSDRSHPVASIIVTIKNTGSTSEGKFLGCGISHLVEHMVFKGAEQGTESQISAKFHALGADIGAFTDKHRTVFTVNMDSRGLNEAIALLPSIIFDNEFEQESFDNEKDVIHRELDMNNDDPERTLIDNVFSCVYRKHPYRHPVGGYRAIFDTVTMKQAFDYYKRHYVPGNIVISISGDFESEDTEAVVRKNFEHYPWKPFKAPAITNEPEQYAPISKNIENSNIRTAYGALAFRTVSAFSPDMASLDILAAALGQGNNSVLMRKLKHEERLVYSANALSYTPDYPGLFLVRIHCEKENLETAKNKALEIVREYTSRELDKTRVEELKNETINSKYFAMQNAQTVAMEIGLGQAIYSNPAYIDEYLEAIAKVTPQSIQRAAEKYLQPERVSFISLIPESQTKHNTEKKQAKEKNKTAIAVLENGLRVAVHTNSRLPIVSAVIAMRGGVSLEEENAGISSLTATMLLRGTSTRNMYEQERRVRAAAGSLSTFSGYHSLGLKLNIPSADIRTGLETMADALKNPLLDEKLIEYEKSLQLKSIELIDEDIYQSALKIFRQTHFAGTPYSRMTQGTRASLEKINQTEIKDFLSNCLNPQDMVIAFSGDITLLQAKKLCEEYFSWLTPKKTSTPAKTEKRTAKGQTVTKKSTFNQSAVIIGFDAPGVLSDDTWTTMLMDAYLSGPSTPLFKKVRDESGAAYMVGTIYLPALDTGAFILYAGTTADKAQKSAQQMMAVVKELKEQKISDTDLQTTKRKTIGKNKIQLQNNAAIAFTMALDELYSKGYKTFLSFEKNTEQLNASDIKAIAEKYLSEKNATKIYFLGKSADK